MQGIKNMAGHFLPCFFGCLLAFCIAWNRQRMWSLKCSVKPDVFSLILYDSVASGWYSWLLLRMQRDSQRFSFGNTECACQKGVCLCILFFFFNFLQGGVCFDLSLWLMARTWHLNGGASFSFLLGHQPGSCTFCIEERETNCCSCCIIFCWGLNACIWAEYLLKVVTVAVYTFIAISNKSVLRN